MGVRTQSADASAASRRLETQRIYELLREIRDDIREIKERLERMDKPANSGKSL